MGKQSSGIWEMQYLPKETPAPVAAGAVYTTAAEATAANNDAVATATKSAAAVGAKEVWVSPRRFENKKPQLAASEEPPVARAAKAAAVEMAKTRNRQRTVMVCSMKNARTPTTVPINSVVTHFATTLVCRPVRRKLRGGGNEKVRFCFWQIWR